MLSKYFLKGRKAKTQFTKENVIILKSLGIRGKDNFSIISRTSLVSKTESPTNENEY